jgi:hypothetical protein
MFRTPLEAGLLPSFRKFFRAGLFRMILGFAIKTRGKLLAGLLSVESFDKCASQQDRRGASAASNYQTREDSGKHRLRCP